MSMKRIIHGFVHPQLKIEPTAEVVFVGNGETLLATLTLINEDSVKKVAVKLKTNLPGTSISVRPKIALIEPRQKVEATLKLRPPLPPNVDARILVSSCSFATFVTLETFDLIWKQAENFKNVSDYFLSIVHKLNYQGSVQSQAITFNANDAVKIVSDPGWVNNDQPEANKEEWTYDQRNVQNNNDQVGTNAGWGDPVAGWGDANPVNSTQQNWDTPNDDNAPAEPAPINDWNTGDNGWGTDAQTAEVVTTDQWGGETNDNQWTAETASNDNNDWNANNQGVEQGETNNLQPLPGCGQHHDCHNPNNNVITGNPLIDAMMILVGILIFGILIGKGWF